MKAEFKKTKLILFIAAFYVACSAFTHVQASFSAFQDCVPPKARERYIRSELYFGLSRQDAPEVPDGEFQKFIDEFVTPRLPCGLTVIDAHGQWREGASVTKERSKVLIVVYLRRDRRAYSANIEEIRSEYKKRFAQSSVMRVDLGKSLDVSF